MKQIFSCIINTYNTCKSIFSIRYSSSFSVPRDSGIYIIMYWICIQMSFFINQYNIGFHKCQSGFSVIEKIISIKIEGIALLNMNFAESYYLILIGIKMRTVAPHLDLVVLKPYISKKMVNIPSCLRIFYNITHISIFQFYSLLVCLIARYILRLNWRNK